MGPKKNINEARNEIIHKITKIHNAIEGSKSIQDLCKNLNLLRELVNSSREKYPAFDGIPLDVNLIISQIKIPKFSEKKPKDPDGLVSWDKAHGIYDRGDDYQGDRWGIINVEFPDDKNVKHY